eukprot:scaffold104210_cov75-Phaeocystis_antarctica.AAC.7
MFIKNKQTGSFSWARTRTPSTHSHSLQSSCLLLGGELGGLGTPCRARAHRASHHGRLGPGGGGAVGAATATAAAAPTLSETERLV